MSIRYKVVVAKQDERSEGPGDASEVFTVPLADAAGEDFDPTVAYMRGILKASGDTGVILEALKSGDAGHAISRLVALA